jgi:hypothetical protein
MLFILEYVLKFQHKTQHHFVCHEINEFGSKKHDSQTFAYQNLCMELEQNLSFLYINENKMIPSG